MQWARGSEGLSVSFVFNKRAEKKEGERAQASERVRERLAICTAELEASVTNSTISPSIGTKLSEL